MSRLSSELEEELETEYEGELENEFEAEDEWEGEGEEFLGALGGIARSVGGLLGEGELEDEFEGEDEWEGEDEAEDEAEEFFKRIGRAFKTAAPFLRILAKTAGPLVATAVGGPAAGALARAVTSQLEGEGEEEVEAEFEEMATAPLSASQATAEHYAARAAQAESEAEAEAFAGVAAYVAISPRERRDLQRMLPSLLRGAAAVTRLLHSNRATRPAVRMVPGIVNAASSTLARRAAAGEPVGPVEVGQVFGQATRRALSGGTASRYVLRRHARGLARIRRHGSPGNYGYAIGTPGYAGRRRIRRTTAPGTFRTPVKTRVATRPVSGRPRPGHVRVVTPVRLPATATRPPRTIRVVSDVKVPRGAVAGRPTTSSNTRRTR
jgi:hypothetical protein